jgi:hypothetical protein
MAKITSLRNTVAGIGLAAVMLFAGVMGALILAGCDTEAKGPPVEPRGYITLDGANIPIYQTAGVADTAIDEDVRRVINGYNGAASVNDDYRTTLKNKIKEVRIVTTETKYIVDNEMYIIDFKTDMSMSDFQAILEGWLLMGNISQIQSPARDGIRLADGKGDAGVPGNKRKGVNHLFQPLA